MLTTNWRWLSLSAAGLIGFFGIAYVVLKLAPDWLAETKGLDAKDRVDARQAVRTASLALLGGAIGVVGVVYTARSFALNRSGQLTDRFTKAIDQLGHDSLDVRLGGIYALERIARDSREDHRQVVEVLTAYVREHAPKQRENVGAQESGRRPDEADAAEGRKLARPTTDLQAVLTVLRRRTLAHEQTAGVPVAAAATRRSRTSGPPIVWPPTGLDLHSTDLRSADLAEASLVGANLAGADLGGALLGGVDLSGAYLYDARLVGADLIGARLVGANLVGAHFTPDPRAMEIGPRLRWADLREAHLTGALLRGADLYKAKLPRARLRGADLREADLSHAQLVEAELARASLVAANLDGADLRRANLAEANLRDTCLTGAQLAAANSAGRTSARQTCAGQHTTATQAGRRRSTPRPLVLTKKAVTDEPASQGIANSYTTALPPPCSDRCAD